MMCVHLSEKERVIAIKALLSALTHDPVPEDEREFRKLLERLAEKPEFREETHMDGFRYDSDDGHLL